MAQTVLNIARLHKSKAYKSQKIWLGSPDAFHHERVESTNKRPEGEKHVSQTSSKCTSGSPVHKLKITPLHISIASLRSKRSIAELPLRVRLICAT